ncbi:unnamed protein product [Heligmosomoides polygyrus]|uniref:Uncharacterized protein n=1 Tax=Heligmosomoides polygyrus TaxID=6339 RepID=A0A183F3A7_HELPZ|nr:unnamed protein product [Heligmosomoides polygyrus]
MGEEFQSTPERGILSSGGPGRTTNGKTHPTLNARGGSQGHMEHETGKAAGPEGVPLEAWKVLGDSGVNWLTQFLNRITKEDMMPDDWRNGTIVPIFK